MSSSDSEYLEIVYGESTDSKGSNAENRKTYLTDCYEVFLASAISVMFWSSPWVLFYMLLNPIFWPLTIPYICWIYYDRRRPHRVGHKFPIIRKLPIFKWTRNYFPIKMVKTAELPADKNYLFGAFPHGVTCYGVACNIMTEANNFSEAYPGLNPYTVTLQEVFSFPLIRDLWLPLGFRASSAISITRILNGPPGSVCVIIVGGAKEMMMSTPGTNKLFLRNRKGFVRLALKTGSSLVPVYSFGETDTFYQPTNELYLKLQAKIKEKTKAPIVALFKGRGIFQKYFGILPYRTPITTVIGKPIDVPRIENPTEEDVNKYHRMFISELEKLFNKFKGKYDQKGEDAVLEIY